MLFVIDDEIYMKSHYCLYEPLNDIRFYFDYTDYYLHEAADIDSADGMVPFVRIREVDVMRAYVESLNDRKLSSVFNKLPDKEAWSRFWAFFDDDGIESEHWGKYDRNYRIDHIVNWCKENGIAYKLLDSLLY